LKLERRLTKALIALESTDKNPFGTLANILDFPAPTFTKNSDAVDNMMDSDYRCGF
jgi:hypothetical protein